jgi:hypothetical protein
MIKSFSYTVESDIKKMCLNQALSSRGIFVKPVQGSRPVQTDRAATHNTRLPFSVLVCGWYICSADNECKVQDDN